MLQKILKTETSELIIKAKVLPEEWKEAQAKSFNKLKSDLLVKGFRKGQVPEQIAKQHISQRDIWTKAINNILDGLAKRVITKIDQNDKILDSPTYNITKITQDELEIDFIYSIYPQIELSEYKNVGIKYKKSNVDNSLVEKELENLREKHALLITKEKEAIAKGDLVKFDFEGLVDGKPFEGNKSEGFVLEIGQNRFIPGFEEQMIGLKQTQEKEIKVVFPKDYHAQELRSKSAIFKVKIHEIKIKQLPKLDNDFAKEVGIKDINTLDQLKKHLHELFIEQNSFQDRVKFVEDLFTVIKEKTKIIIAPQLIAKEKQAIIQQFEENLKSQNYTIDDYVKGMGTTREKLDQQFVEQANKRLHDSFIFAEIARREKIKPDDQDFEKQYQKLAKIYKKSIEEIKKLISPNQAQVPIINEKVIDRLIELNS